MSLEPAAAAIAGLILLDQVLQANEWAGMALVIVASAGATALRPTALATRRMSATASMCGVCGNMSTGWTDSSS